MLEVLNLQKWFTKGGIFQRSSFKVINDISFRINRGETFGLVGESGCGKTTVGRLVLRLIEPSSGTVIFDGKDITSLKNNDLRKIRPRMQMIFQDPNSSLDPRMKIGASIGEALKLKDKGLSRSKVNEAVLELIGRVGLNPEHVNRYPYQMSGGQNQRVVLARVLAMKPDFVVADEPTSGLDISVQAQILNLIKDLKNDMKITTMFISHDLDVIKCMSDRMAVMYKGKIVEVGRTKDILYKPLHPYTKLLIESIGADDHNHRDRDIRLGKADGHGCVLYSSCPFAKGTCVESMPKMVEVEEGRFVLCDHI